MTLKEVPVYALPGVGIRIMWITTDGVVEAETVHHRPGSDALPPGSYRHEPVLLLTPVR